MFVNKGVSGIPGGELKELAVKLRLAEKMDEREIKVESLGLGEFGKEEGEENKEKESGVLQQREMVCELGDVELAKEAGTGMYSSWISCCVMAH